MKKKEIRKRAGWSQDRVAVTAGTSRTMVHLYESLDDEEQARALVPPRTLDGLSRVWAQLASPVPTGVRFGDH
jgi:transcriptional regulator with XRE-family HTH domain